jgi:hypothetical protein
MEYYFGWLHPETMLTPDEILGVDTWHEEPRRAEPEPRTTAEPQHASSRPGQGHKTRGIRVLYRNLLDIIVLSINSRAQLS